MRRPTVGPPIPISPLSPGEQRPFWSVMVPTRDRLGYLREALESVLAQGIGPDEMEIQVVDNGSTRVDVAALVRQLTPDGRVEYVRQAEPLDMAANWTSCISRARGQWVHIMHDDDVLEPGFYAAYREFIQAHPEVVFLLCQVTQIDEEGALRNQMFGPPGMDWTGIVENARTRLVEWDWVAPAAVVAQRSAYERVGGFRPYRHVLDWEMWMRLAEVGSVGYIHRPLVRYRFHTSSATVTSLKTGNHIREIADLIETALQPIGPSDRQPVRRIARHAYSGYAAFLAEVLRSRHEYRAALHHAWWAVRLKPDRSSFQCLRACLRDAAGNSLKGIGLRMARSSRSH